MREPKPFFRAQTESWYLQLGKQQISLGKDKETAWEEYHKLMGKRTDGVSLETDSVARLLNRYLAWLEANRARPTFEKALRHLKSFGQKAGPNLKVSRLKPYHVQHWIDEHYAKASDTYKNAAITVVKAALNWCEQQGYIPHNPIAKMKKPSPAIREFIVPAVKWPEVLAVVRGQEFKDFVTFMLDSGARPQEVCRAEVRHFDRDNCRLVFPRAESKGKKRPRVIYLPPVSFEIVDRLAKQHKTGAIFRTTKDTPWTKNSVNCRFKRLKRELKMPKLCATVLRHSYGHHRLVTGTDSLVISKLMGHVDGRMLATRYGHIDQNPAFMLEQARKTSNPSLAQTNGTPLGSAEGNGRDHSA
jgi:integrase